MALTAPLCFVAKGVHAALGAQVRVGAGLEVVVVTAWRARCVKVTRWTWCIAAGTTVVKLAGGTWSLSIARLAVAVACWAFAAAWGAVTKLGAFAIACRTIAHTVSAHMTVRSRCAAFRRSTLATTAAATIATTASGFGVANALHHFTACGFGCSSHHVSAWGFA